MAYWEQVTVDPNFAGSDRRERRGGSYRRYHPDRLTAVANTLSPAVTEHAADTTAALARLGARLRAQPLPALYSTTLRSESISSSWIEGIRATPRDIAVAQIASHGDELALHRGGVQHNAAQIVRNIGSMREAIDLLGAGPWEHGQLWSIHHELLPWHPSGYREGQVWVGGATSLEAEYAGPPAETVTSYMEDLLDYANSSGDLPVVLAAIVHAQFETIHPFADGNGRVGRALVHGVLKRAGLVDGGVIPLSAILRDDVRGYVSALTVYRYDGKVRGPALDDYVDRFLSFVASAVVAADGFVDAATSLQHRWRGMVEGVRSDAALHRALDIIVENPVVTTRFLADRLGISLRRTELLVKQLEHVRILAPATGKYRNSPLYQADEILTLLSFGAEATPRTPPPSMPAVAPSDTGGPSPVLRQRCGEPTTRGPCRNRVAESGQKCWRHRG